MKKIYRIIKKYIPLPAIILYILFVLAGVIHLLSLISKWFSDFFNENISAFFRMILAKLTNLLPFSLAEFIIMFLPVIIVIVFVISFKYSKDLKSMLRFLTFMFSIVTLVYTIFVFNFATGYRGSTLEDKLDLNRTEISVEELNDTAELLLKKAYEYITEIDYIYGGHSVMPYSLDEMNVKLNDAYAKLAKKHSFLPNLKSNIKYVLLSDWLSYTHISGVYTYYTGEANLNISFPDYTLPFTAAHELSHQRGIAREDEANFMAFLICIESDDPYILYSAYLHLFEYVSNALYEADRQMYMTLLNRMDNRIRSEMIAYNQFFKKYEGSVVSGVSATINDTFLKLQGQSDGRKSYGRVVDLAVAYYRSNIDG